MTRIRRASLLIVLAHPDDEIFHGGVLAHLSERGVRVTLVCATNGEAGKPHPSVGPVEDHCGREAARDRHLRTARQLLSPGSPRHLARHDGGVLLQRRHGK